MAQNCKYYREKKQVSYDNGVTYVDVSPAEYRKGDLIQSGSSDCGGSSSGYSNQYLTFVAVDGGTFKFNGTSSSTVNNSSIQYSTDNGSTWYTLNRGVNSPTISAGNKIMWKSSTLSPTGSGIGTFVSTGRFNVEGNSMSLYYGDNFANQTNLNGKNDAFKCLFSACTNVISAANLVLPATTLSTGCYRYMFFGCTSLTTAPQLPATTMAEYCYSEMFQRCASLTTAPSLPATTLAADCYFAMFAECTSLVTAPSVLPATTLSSECYANMFAGCTSLTSAPELPAATLVYACYSSMFSSCSSLNYVKCLATNISADSCTFAWLWETQSTGTFVKNSSMSSWTEGASGIPSNWTVQNA